MNVPGFTASASLVEAKRKHSLGEFHHSANPAQQQQVEQLRSRHGVRSNSTETPRDATDHSVVPAARDERQEAYAECLAECRMEGGTNCVNRCLVQTAPPRGYGSETRGMPFYGNYCGPGHGDPTYRTPPVDAVDAVCMDHDRCYDARGYLNCGCDYALITRMPFAIIDTPSPEGKLAGAAAQAWFAGAPCTCWGFPVPLGVGGQGPC